MNAMERYTATVDYRKKRDEAIESLRLTPPVIGKWSKRFRKMIPMATGELECKDARLCIVYMRTWSPLATVTVGVWIDETTKHNGSTSKLYACFDWHIGAGLSYACYSRKAALNEAIITLQMQGHAEYLRRVEELNNELNGKHRGSGDKKC